MKKNDFIFMAVLSANLVLWFVGIIFMLIKDNPYINLFVIAILFLVSLISFGITLEKTEFNIPILDRFLDKLDSENNF